MVDFTKKRLQVFVSSTYTDLIAERQAAVEAILTAGHIPAGMELFAAGDESQLEAIKQWIDESDVYLMILGGRYGSIESDSGKSYTHLEYDYAVSKGKPLFACVVNEQAQEARVKLHGTSVVEQHEPKKLREFRNLVTGKLVRFWDDHKDIKITIGETLAQFARRPELVGWTRQSPDLDIPQLAAEIARLSQENSALRTQLTAQSTTDMTLSFDEMREMLETKGLLDFLLNTRNFLLDRYGFVVKDPEQQERVRELALLGIITTGTEGWRYFFSEAGKKFVTRFELAQNRSE
jgi:nucleoside 2-deoxyribosyltransferase